MPGCGLPCYSPPVEPRVLAVLQRRTVPSACSSPEPSRARDVAFTALGAGLVVGASYVVPYAGTVAGVVGVAELARLKDRAERRACGLDAPSSASCPPHVNGAVERALAGRRLDGDDEACRAWSAWLPWDDLHAGAKVPVPGDLPHPAEAGFHRTNLASHVGQSADWAKRVGPGRLHVHEYAGEAGAGGVNAMTFARARRYFVVHLDRRDPERSDGVAVAHWFAETPEGRALGMGALAVSLGLLGLWVTT
jgi:hypothetical protein